MRTGRTIGHSLVQGNCLVDIADRPWNHYADSPWAIMP